MGFYLHSINSFWPFHFYFLNPSCPPLPSCYSPSSKPPKIPLFPLNPLLSSIFVHPHHFLLAPRGVKPFSPNRLHLRALELEVAIPATSGIMPRQKSMAPSSHMHSLRHQGAGSSSGSRRPPVRSLQEPTPIAPAPPPIAT